MEAKLMYVVEPRDTDETDLKVGSCFFPRSSGSRNYTAQISSDCDGSLDIQRTFKQLHEDT